MKLANTYCDSLLKEPPLPFKNIFQYLLTLEPNFDIPDELEEDFTAQLYAIEQLIKKNLPKELFPFIEAIKSYEDRENISKFYKALEETIPYITWTKGEEKFPYIMSITTLSYANHTHGAGRFIADAYSKWLVPGKQLQLVFLNNSAFRFKANPSKPFFLQQLFVKIENKKDFAIAEAHLESLTREVKLNILAVQHTREIISNKTLTFEQKKAIIQENISSLLEKPLIDAHSNIFEEMQHFLFKAVAEDKLIKVKEVISPLTELRPQLFERDLFSELQKFAFLFRDVFMATRSLKHLTRIITYSYLFRKIVTQDLLTSPHQRHLSIKLLHATVAVDKRQKHVLGVLIVINLLRDTEIIGEKHLFDAIGSIISKAKIVPESIINDRRSNNQIRTIYLEVYKEKGTRFSRDEIKKIKTSLPREIKTRIESVLNPIFMPRNEEEVMRNILILSNQLKYTQDIPQVIISFHKQTEDKLSFTIILLRILKPKDPPLGTLFQKCNQDVVFSDHDIKIMGLLRKKYPKEANVFEMHLNKKAFLRQDFSVDLNQARRFVYKILTSILGDIRDYNGGMISKQTEVLNELKKLLLQLNIHNDFILENFFYSLSPNYMQSILKPHILKKIFILVLEALEHNYSSHIYFLKTQIVENYFLVTIATINPTLKEYLEPKIDQIEFPPSTLTSSYLNIYDISCLSYILKFQDSEEHEQFLRIIIEGIKVWKETMIKSLPMHNL